MSDAEQIRRFQVLHARHMAAVATGVERIWDGLGSYDDADVALWLASVLPFLSSSNEQLVALVDGYVAAMSSTEPLGITAVQPRPTPPETVYRRPFIEHWTGLSNGRTYESTVNTGRARAVALAKHDSQIVMREAMNEIVRIHVDEPERIARIPRIAVERSVPVLDPASLDTVADEQRRLQRLQNVTQQVPEPEVTELPPRSIVGWRRVLTGRSCVFCATASTKVYKRGDLAPLHAHCDCAVAPVYLGEDPAFDLNREVLTNLKSRGKAYWKQRGFVDNDGRPVDPTDLPEAIGAATSVPEVGAVFSNA